MNEQQQSNHNLGTSNCENQDGNRMKTEFQLPSHHVIIIETVEYKDDYIIIQEENEDCETNELMVEDDNKFDDNDDESVDNVQMDTTHLIGQPQMNSRKRKQTQYQEQQPTTKEVNSNRDNKQKDAKMEEDDDDEEVIFVSVKRSRRTTSKNSKTEQEQIITLTLRCPQNCGEIAKEEFIKHLKKRHSIGPFQCLVKGCMKSFNRTNLLGQHLTQTHHSSTQLHCDKCASHFPSYKQLYNHNREYHQLGHFQCSYPSCTFTGECRKTVYNHYARQHKSGTVFKCPHPTCQYETPTKLDLQRHHLGHLPIKPYRCKWERCEYAAKQSSDTVRHVRLVHLATNSRHSLPNAAQLDPKDYVEIVYKL